MRRVTPRKTWIFVNGVRLNLNTAFTAITEPRVAYAVFRTRCRSAEKRGLLDQEALSFAATATRADWISFYGGGRARSFVYDGDDFPELRGNRFRSISSFLIKVGHHDKLHTVWDRLKRGWDVDTAIREPVLRLTERRGLIYCATCRPTGKKYVGLTLVSMTTRWQWHIARAHGNGARSLLHRAIRVFGPASFDLSELEGGLDVRDLGDRERFWIEQFGTVAPNGLNAIRGGQLGGGRGVTTVYEGRTFRSRQEAAAVLSNETGLAPHVVATRLAAGAPLPARARSASRHPEAGSRHWRRWKSLLKRFAETPDEICSEWQDFDAFKGDTLPSFRDALRLTRIDAHRPWSPTNFAWRSAREILRRSRTARQCRTVMAGADSAAAVFSSGSNRSQNRLVPVLI